MIKSDFFQIKNNISKKLGFYPKQLEGHNEFNRVSWKKFFSLCIKGNMVTTELIYYLYIICLKDRHGTRERGKEGERDLLFGGSLPTWRQYLFLALAESGWVWLSQEPGPPFTSPAGLAGAQALQQSSATFLDELTGSRIGSWAVKTQSGTQKGFSCCVKHHPN